MEKTIKMKNLTSTELEDTKNIVIAPENEEKFIHLPFNKKDKYFSNPIDLIKFIKDVETLIRTSKEYSKYIRYLKEDVGLRSCAIMREINDTIAPIEMHHGPIFTLYDIVEIQISHLYKNGLPINSCRLSHNVLKDHWDRIIQVVMLCKTAHLGVHNFNSGKDNNKMFFLTADAAYGDINKFILKYYNAFTVDHYNKIRNYITRYNAYKKNDAKNEKTNIFMKDITEWANKLSKSI
jgi:hypothetical protein